MEQSLLLNYIGYLWMLHKNYYKNIHNKYKFGISCECEEQNLVLASFMIEEVENYYNDCSCLTEEEICNLIVTIQNLLK
jgi:hypothetical protein